MRYTLILLSLILLTGCAETRRQVDCFNGGGYSTSDGQCLPRPNIGPAVLMMPMMFEPSQPYQPLPIMPIGSGIETRRPLTCTSNQWGASTYTNCY